MIEVKRGPRTFDLPYTIHVEDVTEEMFDELTDEDTRAELIDGVMIVHSPASLRHDSIANFIRFLMSGYAAERELGTVLGPDGLVRLARGRRFGPDIFFVRLDRMPAPMPKQFEGAPDLVVEVLSPSNRAKDVALKRPGYRDAGVQEIWLVDSDQELVTIDRKRGGKYLEKTFSTGRVTSTALQGFWLDAAWLWSDPLPNVMACLREILST